MPCRDHWPTPADEDRFSEIRNLRKRNDLLAAEACAARTALVRVVAELRQAAGNVFPTSEAPLKDWLAESNNRDLLAVIDAQTEAHRAHREMDRAEALRVARRDLKVLKDKLANIERLGGVPSAKQTKQRSTLIRAVKAIKDSDPMETDLY